MSISSSTLDFKIPVSEDVTYVSTNKDYTWVVDRFRSVVSPRTSVSIGVIGEISVENEEIINQIKSFQSLKENWDEENAKEIPRKTLLDSINIVEELNNFDINVYLTSPGPNREILLLIKSHKRELEIIIYPNKQKFVKFEDKNFIEQGDFNLEKLFSLVEWVN